MSQFKSYYPINLNLKNKKCVVIGGGEVAQRKVKSLLKFGAGVTVISPNLSKGLLLLKKNKKIIHINKKYNSFYLKGAFLVIGATDSRIVDISLNKLSPKNNFLLNIVDKPDYGNFIVPAVIKRGPLTISVSTSGVSPALARKIRIDLEKHFSPKYEKLLNLLAKVRPSIIKEVKDIKKRRKIFKKLANLDIKKWKF